MKFLIDHNIAPRIARALHAIYSPEGHSISAISECEGFSQEMIDVDIFSTMSRQGGKWAFITLDNQIRRTRAEREAWLESGHVVFFLKKRWQAIPLEEQAGKLIIRFRGILKLALNPKKAKGFVVKVGSTKIEQA